jgi:glycosyltransferase involved in cell wall biosynthesis
MKNASDIAVSVIVPVHKLEKYLEQCLDSICAQTLENIEIVCSYTDSPDSTLTILEKYAKNDARVKIVRRDDGGLGGARNFGLLFARGEYIAFVDGDDWIAENMLFDLYSIAKQDDVDIVICAIASYNDTTGEPIPDDWCSTLPFPRSLDGRSFNYKALDPDKFISSAAPVAAWNKLYRRAFLEENQLRFPENIRYEDNPFYYEAMIKAGRVRFTRERYYFYRKNRAGSLQDSPANDKSAFDIIKILVGIGEIFDANQVSQPVKDALTRYIIAEFSWRYFFITGKKRQFLQAIRDECPKEIYDKFIATIKEKGASEAIINGAFACMVKVSVIIPVYNAGEYLAETLDSVLSQTLADIEVICVDDKSTDNSVQVLISYSKRDPRVKILESAANGGAGVCRDKALETATGEFVFFLDSDDLLPDENVLSQMFDACMENKMLTCGGNIMIFNNNNRSDLAEYQGTKFEKNARMSYCEYSKWPSWGFFRFLYNIEIIWENNINFQGLRYYEDPYFLVCYMSKAKEFFALNRTVYLYMQNPTHHSTLSTEQFHDYFIAEYDILNMLKDISMGMYYKEYTFFLEVCGKLRKNESPELIAMSDEIFRDMDFTEADKYIDNSKVFRSYKAFLRGLVDKTSVTEKLSVLWHIARRRFESILKRVLKLLFGSIYRSIRKRLVIIVQNALYGEFYAVKARLGDINARLGNVDAELDDINAALFSVKGEFGRMKAEISRYHPEFLYDYTVSNLIQKKKIFLVGTAEHSNIGDAAIVSGELEFIKKYYPDYAVVEIPTYLFSEQYPLMRAAITNDDLIFLHGGGNLGTLYLNEENVRRTVVSDYSNHKIVILPQTIYFSEDAPGMAELRISAEIYNRHKNLTLFTRGLQSLRSAQAHFANVPSSNALDCAFLLNADFGYDRNGILLCIRDLTDESGLTEQQYNAVFQTVAEEYPEYDRSNNLYGGDIPKDIRRRVVDDELKLFARHRVIVTDRLHGLVFSVITRTPCVLISSYRQKIAEFAENFADSNAVFFIDKRLEQINTMIKAAFTVDMPCYPLLDSKPFDAMFDFINSPKEGNLHGART